MLISSSGLPQALLNCKVAKVGCGPYCTVIYRSVSPGASEESVMKPVAGTAKHSTSVRLMTPSTLLTRIEKDYSTQSGVDHPWSHTVSPERDITLVKSSYASLVEQHKLQHQAKKHTGAYGVLPPLSQERREQKSLMDLRTKTPSSRWRSGDVSSRHARRRSVDQMSHHARARMEHSRRASVS